MATKKLTNDQLFKLQKQSLEGLMKLMEVDILKLRTLEKDMIKTKSTRN